MIELHNKLERLRTQGHYRELSSTQKLTDFSSNDYLGLANSESIRQQLVAELSNGCLLGATGSRLLSGNTDVHHRVEEFLSRAFKVDSALIFSSGFLANLGIINAFSSLHAEFFSDEFNHASLVDGMRTSKIKPNVFRHNDVEHLELLLRKSRNPVRVIATESVFSMHGDLAPLADILLLAETFNAFVIVDEAHATGIFGMKGLGRLNDFPSVSPLVIAIHTAGKALGGQGAFILSSNLVRKLLVNEARSFIFSTALSPLSCLQIEFATAAIMKNPERGENLLGRAASFKEQLQQRFDCGKSQSQVIPLILNSAGNARLSSEKLRRRGFDVRAIRSPSVPLGQERLRLTLKSFHSESQVDELRNALFQEILE